MTTNSGNNNTRKPNQNKFQKKAPRFNFMWIYFFVILALGFVFRMYGSADPVKTEWLTVKEQMIPAGDVEKITYITNLQKAEVYIQKDSRSKYVNKYFGGREPSVGPHFFFIVSPNFNAEENLEEARLSLPMEQRFIINTETRENYFGKLLEWFIFPLLIFGILWFIM